MARTVSQIVGTALIGSPQAQLASVAYAALFVTLLVSVLVRNGQDKDPKQKLSGGEIAVVFIFLAIAYLLSIFSINCMVVGAAAQVGCGVWAWVTSAIVLILAVVVVLSTAMGN